MATRTARLDDQTEAALQQIRAATGMPIPEALEPALQALEQRLQDESRHSPCSVYRRLAWPRWLRNGTLD
jgi:hypothetical protein